MSQAPAKPIVVDRSRHPLIVTTLTGKPTLADVQAHQREMDGLLAENRRYGMLVDMRAAESGDREAQRQFAAWMKANRPRIEKLTVGSALVLAGAVPRAALSAVLWMQPIPGPYAIFKDVAAGEKWLRERMREARVTIFAPDQPEGYIPNEA